MSRFPITMMRSPAPIMNDDIYIINSQDSILEEKNPIGHFDCFTCCAHVTLLNLLVHNWPTMYNHYHWKYLNKKLRLIKSVPFLFGSNLSLKSPKLYDSELGWPVISVRPLSPGLFESSSSERTPRFLFDSSFLRVLTLNLKFRVFLSNFEIKYLEATWRRLMGRPRCSTSAAGIQPNDWFSSQMSAIISLCDWPSDIPDAPATSQQLIISTLYWKFYLYYSIVTHATTRS